MVIAGGNHNYKWGRRKTSEVTSTFTVSGYSIKKYSNSMCNFSFALNDTGTIR